MKIMFHYINKKNNSSPTIVSNRIKDLLKNFNFSFCDLIQGSSAKGFINFKLLSNLAGQIKNENPDVIVLCGIASGFHAAIAAKKCGIKKIILITHGIESLNPDRSWLKRKIFKYIIEPLTIIISTDIQCNSKFVYNLWSIKTFAKNKRHLIYNPMPVVDKSIIKKKCSSSNDFVVVCASRIIKNKGYDLIVDAIKKINNNDIKYVFVGDGKY